MFIVESVEDAGDIRAPSWLAMKGKLTEKNTTRTKSMVGLIIYIHLSTDKEKVLLELCDIMSSQDLTQDSTRKLHTLPQWQLLDYLM